MAKPVAKKVLVYCLRGDQILVFRHIDHPWEEVGLQVPGGSIRDDETPLAAALRELREETGRGSFEIEDFLGTSFYDLSPHRLEIQERYFFRARPTDDLPERWPSQENHDGTAPPTRLECFWIPVVAAHVLQAGQGALLGQLEMPGIQGGRA